MMTKTNNKKTFALMLATFIVNAWYDYWAYKSKHLPNFLLHVMKGTLLYIVSIICILYVSAWAIYGVPPSENPYFLISSTLLSLFGDFPSFLMRLVTKAPADMTYDQILWDAIFGYTCYYWDFTISCTLITLITGVYISFLLKTSLYYRHDDLFWNRMLAYGSLLLFGVIIVFLLYYCTLPFITSVMEEGLALRIIKMCWRFISWVLNLDPYAEQKRNARYKSESRETFKYHKSDSGSRSQFSRDRAYSPSEPKRSWSEWWHNKPAKHPPEAAPTQPQKTPPIMSSRVGAQQMAEANNTLGKQISFSKREALENLDRLLKNPEKNKEAIDFARGEINAWNNAQDYQAACSHRQAQVLASTTHIPQDPQNLKEAGQRALAVSADRLGQTLGELSQQAAAIAYERTLRPGDDDIPPSPRDPYA